MPEVKNIQNNPFLTIFQGKFAQKVEAGTPNAVSRVNKLGATIHEIYYQAWRGIVKGWSIQESEYGTSLNVFFDDVTLSLGGKMMSEFIKKFASADKQQEITVSPFPDFVGKNGIPKKSGLTLLQNGERLYSYFSEYDEKTKEYNYINGYPAPPKKWTEMSESEKKIYYIQVEDFLKNWVTLNPINNIGVDNDESKFEEEIQEPDLSKVPLKIN